MNRQRALWLVLVIATVAVTLAVSRNSRMMDVAQWQRQVSPGALSRSHAPLATNCTACHTPVRSVDATKCIACHINNIALLQREPTAFHATIGSCSRCHGEHQGATVRPVAMDHSTLAEIGLEDIERNSDNVTNRRLLTWVEQHTDTDDVDSAHPLVTPSEAALDCASCHSTKDRHQGLFGRDCASCHAAMSWTIPLFQHPSPRSVDCVQCHQAPPSHYMMHFQMVSQGVARAPGARVEQCFVCHQTTSWNDIRGVGWYKHH